MSTFDYSFDKLLNPCLKAFHQLGGSGTNQEVETKVIEILKLSKNQINEIHRGNVTKLNYRLRWARNYLKRDGILENPSRAVWALTEKGRRITKINVKELVRRIAELDSCKKKQKEVTEDSDNVEEVEELEWQEELLDVVKRISPGSFERLCQRLLRELGFNQVEVTGRSGDGGIDGKGILKIGSVITFRVVFQCKRYKDTVSTSTVRDFRGAVQGRADKGLLISTGSFTRDARIEAQRDGALAIDLMDGNELAERLKELSLGVDVEMVEEVTVKKDWFSTL